MRGMFDTISTIMLRHGWQRGRDFNRIYIKGRGQLRGFWRFK
jgi:hypothetical protein